jgi:hypothetical protein
MNWATEQIPAQAAGQVILHTAAGSQGMAWAFGISVEDSKPFGTLVFHRETQGWQRMAAPHVGRVNRAIAIADDDVWGVGDGTSLHWDGARWQQVATAALEDTRTQLFGLAQFGTDDVWTAGYAPRRDHSAARGTVQHWDGQQWTDLPVPAVAPSWALAGIGGVSRDDLWTVGRKPGQGVALHWDGHGWQQPPVPGPPSAVAKLCDVAALASDDVWAAGYRTPPDGGVAGRRPFAVHWDGRAWSLASISDEPAQIWQLVKGEGCLWGIGYTSAGMPFVTRLSGSAWQILPGPTSPHTTEYSRLYGGPTLHGGAILPGGRLLVVGATSSSPDSAQPFAASGQHGTHPKHPGETC